MYDRLPQTMIIRKRIAIIENVRSSASWLTSCKKEGNLALTSASRPAFYMRHEVAAEMKIMAAQIVTSFRVGQKL